jgi:hypothetical protein
MVEYDVTPPAEYNYELLKHVELAALPDYDSMSIVDGGQPGEVWRVRFADGTTTTQQDVQDVMDHHDHTQLTEGQRLQQIRESGEQSFAALPGWATWTVQEAEDYIETNVTDLASAKVVLKALAKAIVAIRNDRWPGLQGG